MMKNRIESKDLLLYGVITKGDLSQESYLKKIENSIDGGVTILQLREKTMGNQEFIQLALEVKKITDKKKIKLIINDNIEVCKKIDCHGIHIGQSDILAEKARKILGDEKIIGLSIQTMKHLEESLGVDIDYYGIGAIFSTSTKLDADIVSLEELKEITKNSKIPSVAIGGLNQNNIDQLKGTGIVGVAIVSAIYKGEDTLKNTRELLEKVNKINF